MSSQEYSRKFRERSDRLGEAIEAARSAARGMSRAEAREQIVAELRARGIVMPPPGVDLIVHDVMLGSGVSGGIRRAVWHLSNAADLAARGAGFISAAARHRPLPGWDLGGGRFLKPDPRVRAGVTLDPGAQESLAIGAGKSLATLLSSRSGSVTPGQDAARPLMLPGLVASRRPAVMSSWWSITGRTASASWDRKPVMLTARPSVMPATRASSR